MSSKQVIRREARERLRSLSTEERRVFGERAAELAWTVPEIASARTILLYASLPEEVPTDGLAAAARDRGITVVYPRCLVKEVAMSLHDVASAGDLLGGGRFGIREPAAHCPVTEVGRIDVGLIPGLAWDREGNRLGRGAGYYDRLLAHPEWRASRCGLFFSVQEFAVLPTDPWDSPLDLVVTEREVWRGEGKF